MLLLLAPLRSCRAILKHSNLKGLGAEEFRQHSASHAFVRVAKKTDEAARSPQTTECSDTPHLLV